MCASQRKNSTLESPPPLPFTAAAVNYLSAAADIPPLEERVHLDVQGEGILYRLIVTFRKQFTDCPAL